MSSGDGAETVTFTDSRVILVTGPSTWTDRGAIGNGLLRAIGQMYTPAELKNPFFDWSKITLRVSAAKSGVVPIAVGIAREWRMTVETVAFQYDLYKGRARQVRDAQMILREPRPNLCVAWRSARGSSASSEQFITLVEKSGVPLLVIDPKAHRARSVR